MKIVVSETYEAMSKKAVDEIIKMIDKHKNPLICTASGDSPAGLYKALVSRVKNNELDITDWSFVSLDEWVGMNENDNGSCSYHLNKQLFEPLKIANNRICFFDGRADDLVKECTKVDDYIAQHGKIDVAIVGLGMNGHVGMNEPGSLPEFKAHVAAIDPITQEVGQKYFKEQQQLSQGVTLGIASLMEARNVVLLVSGRHKAEIVKQVLQGEISNQFPAGLLRKHPAFYVFLDKEAACLINE